MASDPDKIRATYKRWWLGQMCRPRNKPSEQFKLVIDMKVIGPPSLFNCVVKVVYVDDTFDYVPMGPNSFRPRKCDMEVQSREN